MKFIEKLEGKTAKNADKVLKYKQWGLLAFIAIPLPGTGAWCGSLIAALFDLDKRWSALATFLGVVISGVIMTLASYGVLSFLSFLL